jgi:hypothetical protein
LDGGGPKIFVGAAGGKFLYNKWSCGAKICASIPWIFDVVQSVDSEMSHRLDFDYGINE